MKTQNWYRCEPCKLFHDVGDVCESKKKDSLTFGECVQNAIGFVITAIAVFQIMSWLG